MQDQIAPRWDARNHVQREMTGESTVKSLCHCGRGGKGKGTSGSQQLLAKLPDSL